MGPVFDIAEKILYRYYHLTERRRRQTDKEPLVSECKVTQSTWECPESRVIFLKLW